MVLTQPETHPNPNTNPHNPNSNSTPLPLRLQRDTDSAAPSNLTVFLCASSTRLTFWPIIRQRNRFRSSDATARHLCKFSVSAGRIRTSMAGCRGSKSLSFRLQLRWQLAIPGIEASAATAPTNLHFGCTTARLYLAYTPTINWLKLSVQPTAARLRVELRPRYYSFLINAVKVSSIITVFALHSVGLQFSLYSEFGSDTNTTPTPLQLDSDTNPTQLHPTPTPIQSNSTRSNPTPTDSNSTQLHSTPTPHQHHSNSNSTPTPTPLRHQSNTDTERTQHRRNANADTNSNTDTDTCGADRPCCYRGIVESNRSVLDRQFGQRNRI